jgi:16S rRNA (uracil1498-N3)-methyltransferase
VAELHGAQVVLSEAQANQIKRVLRLRDGDLVRVFVSGDEQDRVAQVQLSPEVSLTLTGEQLPAVPEHLRRLTSAVALLPREKLEQLLPQLVEVGVSAIRPVLTGRTVARSLPDEARLSRWQAILREATEQCGRAVVPVLLPPLPLETALGEALLAGHAWLAHPDGSQPVQGLSRTAEPAEAVTLFTGPEGGFAPEEIERAQMLGAALVTHPGPVLRAETAAPVLAALVLASSAVVVE